MEKILLAMAPLVDDDIVDHSAPAHISFLQAVLGYFGRALADVLYIVANNCPTNGSIAAIMKVPFVGYASHRLNLAVMKYMKSYEDLLDRVQLLMHAINAMDDATTALMPSRRKINQLRGLLEELKAFESSSKKLQSADGLSLLDVRDTFDALIAEHPGVEGYLG
ncbi:hypothetical protein GN244_ATG06683 [Phytophthora infestans]|uniref:Uncharacterized protein n=1 Tax=Phytophthora infestans TaxID=4787 RepID=A0A833WLP0_PHYIN|nr:hypothetical protein GN244_ATG06683 [Phytophthora infestans]